MQAKITARNVAKHYDTPNGAVTAIDHFDLDVEEGEFVCIVGPSGCGKTTFLRILADLVPLSSGDIVITPSGAEKKPLNNVVFQEYAIFPWKTVRENVAFGLHMRGVPRAERNAIADEWLARVGLSKFAESFPGQLSGGMKQRVSIARALANDPEVLLMDEPLGALDAQTRAVMQEELLRIWEDTRKTVVYVTHSIDESVLLGDRVIVMTAHPGQKKAEFRVDIARPRTIQTASEAEFGALRGSIWQALEDEVKKAMQAQQ